MRFHPLPRLQMPYNGAGTFTVYTPGNPVVTNTTISSTVHNATNSDFASGLSNAITKDGQTQPTADLPMNGFKHTNVGAATQGNQYATLGQLQSKVIGLMRTIGIRCQNNSTTPATKYDMTASKIQVANSSNEIFIVTPSTVTNDILTAGPVANGRDQAGAFTDPSFIHFYFIWNGTDLATLSSASATSPTLPTGYTHSAYAGAIYFTSGALRMTRIVGRTAYNETRLQVLSSGFSTSEASVSLTAAVPSNVLSARLSYDLNSTVAANLIIAIISFATGTTYFELIFGGASGNLRCSGQLNIPVYNQNIFYRVGTDAQRLSLYLDSYDVPNAE